MSQAEETERTVPADNFVATIAANVDNDRLSDAEFRAFIRRTLPIVQHSIRKPILDEEYRQMAQERWDELAAQTMVTADEIAEQKQLALELGIPEMLLIC